MPRLIDRGQKNLHSTSGVWAITGLLGVRVSNLAFGDEPPAARATAQAGPAKSKPLRAAESGPQPQTLPLFGDDA